MPVWLITDVDVEFDCLRFPSFSLKYEKKPFENPGLTKGVSELLEFFNKYNIKATFHVQEQKNPDFSVLLRYPKVCDLIEKFSQEISLHVHVEAEDYVSRKNEISAGFERLKEQGYKIASFKAGWHFTNENTIKVLEELGIKYDCSPIKNLVIGPIRFYDIPDSPYHPSYDNVTKIGNAKILMIPVTNSRLGIAIHKQNSVELELMKKGSKILISMAEKIKQPIIIYFTTHSWKPFDPGGSERLWERQRREEFFSFLKEYDVKSLSVSEAGYLWRRDAYEPYFLDLPDLVGSYRAVYNPLRHLRFIKHVLSRLYVFRYKLFKKL